ncbi:MAG: hypothetical protein AM1032_000370 [Mycoplasmataceae bacterium]|nr:MAG: hypothetical protein AM1032_000370 [Mycoplasmataceae bacterium]
MINNIDEKNNLFNNSKMFKILKRINFIKSNKIAFNKKSQNI